MPSPPFQTHGQNQVLYWEDVESCQETATAEGVVESRRRLFCLWKDRLAFRADLIGWSAIQFPSGPAKLRRGLPEVHPEIPKMYCVEANMIGGKGVPQYDSGKGHQAFYASTRPATQLGDGGDGYAWFDTKWSYVPYVVLGDTEIGGNESLRFVEINVEPSIQSISLPGATFRFVTAIVPAAHGRIIPEGLPLLLPQKAYRLRWHSVPSTNNLMWPGLETNIDMCLGKVNSATYLGKDPGTLLCEAPHIEKRRGLLGTDVFFIEHVLLYKGSGWNKVYRRDLTTGPGFDEVETFNAATGASLGKSIYEEEDFTRLFSLNVF